MFHSDDPDSMTPEQRLREVARLLLQGILNFKQRGGTLIPPTNSALAKPQIAKRKEVANDLR